MAPIKKPTVATRDAVKAAAGSMCWLCGRDGHDVAHIIAMKNTKLFDMYFCMGLLGKMAIRSFGNLMFLCGSCHHLFDEEPSAWIFLPKDLNGFLETEEQFQIDRLSAAESGRLLRRCAPTEDPEREFIRYQIRDVPTQSESLTSIRIKKWAGNPITPIVHASEVIYKHIRLSAEKYGLPEEVAETLQRLLFLYGKPAPEVSKKTPNTEIPEDAEIPPDTGVTQNVEVPQNIEMPQEPNFAAASSKRKRADTTDIEDTCSDNDTSPSNREVPQKKRKRRTYALTERKRIEALEKEKERAKSRARANEKEKEKEKGKENVGPDSRDLSPSYYGKGRTERKKK